MSAPRVALLHVYSRGSDGDGLLADLSLDRLRRVGIPPHTVTVVALDARSFSDLPHVVAAGTPTRRPSLRAARAAATVAATTVGRGMHSTLRHADAFVGVGGGYILGNTRVATVGMWLNHVPQMMAAGRSGRPSIYLPVSVGPFRGHFGRRIPDLLSAIGSVCVRDDPSLDALAGHPGAHRVPDLAVLDVAEAGRPPIRRAPRVAISARELGRDPEYISRLRELAGRLPDALWAVQVEGVGSKSDRVFYDRIGVDTAGSMSEVLTSGEVGAVVSVRLHGALMAIRAGVPAVHLAYGTKGPGAYDDLGILDLLHDARSFDASEVARQARALIDDPVPFWARIADRRPHLLEQSEHLTHLVADCLGTNLKDRR